MFGKPSTGKVILFLDSIAELVVTEGQVDNLAIPDVAESASAFRCSRFSNETVVQPI